MIKEAIKLALEALKKEHENYCLYGDEDGSPEYIHEAIKALEEALAKQEQGEPVAWQVNGSMVVREDWIERLHWPFEYVATGRAIPDNWVPVLYTTPQQRTWVGLTDDEIEEIWGEDLRVVYSGNIEATKAIEAKLKEKNT